MTIRPLLAMAMAAALLSAGDREARGQVTLADDIIMAAQGKENAERERSRESPLGRTPGTGASPYRRTPGSDDIRLGVSSTRRPAAPRRHTPSPSVGDVLTIPDRGPIERGHGLAPMIGRLSVPAAGGIPPRDRDRNRPGPVSRNPEGARARPDALHLEGPSGREGPRATEATENDPVAEAGDEGDPDGLTLDAAIDRLLHANRELRTKFLELPQAEADILSAGLRENPLLFYSSDSIPYGSYSPRRPGEIAHGISLVYPVDYSGKRRARVETARTERRVLEAQYRDAVRSAIDELYSAYVDVIVARQEARAARGGVGAADRLLAAAQARASRSEADEEAIDDLIIERDLAAMADDAAQERLQRARHRLGRLLDLDPREAEAVQVRGSLRMVEIRLPPRDDLACVALRNRPDLAAYRLGVERSRAAFRQERAERFSDAYLLYTPFEYHDNQPVRLESAVSWGAGLFVSLPLFNRNQGNIQRARLNIDQSRNEAEAREREVVAEVFQAAGDFEDSLADSGRLERVTLPAVRRKLDRARAREARGEIAPSVALDLRRDMSALFRYHRETLARHRRNTLRINTVVGMRLLP